jgi:hypothetical protein
VSPDAQPFEHQHMKNARGCAHQALQVRVTLLSLKAVEQRFRPSKPKSVQLRNLHLRMLYHTLSLSSSGRKNSSWLCNPSSPTCPLGCMYTCRRLWACMHPKAFDRSMPDRLLCTLQFRGCNIQMRAQDTVNRNA